MQLVLKVGLAAGALQTHLETMAAAEALQGPLALDLVFLSVLLVRLGPERQVETMETVVEMETLGQTVFAWLLDRH